MAKVDNQTRQCRHCERTIDRDTPYVYVEVHPFRRFLEPQAERVAAFHAACYELVRPSCLPDAGYHADTKGV